MNRSAFATPPPTPIAIDRVQPAPGMHSSRKVSPRRDLITVRGLQKSYRRASCPVQVLCGIDMQVRDGEFLAIVGQSGSGKSTLLHLLSALDSADEGSIVLRGVAIERLGATARDRLRNREFGIIFQFYHLLPELSALENVLLSQLIACGPISYWKQRGGMRQRAIQLLERVGLSHRVHHKPRELSGGEMQRVAIARALMAKPSILFADEPTGNLDRQTGSAIMELLQGLNSTEGLTVILVTHDPGIAEQAHRRIRLVEGKVLED